MQICHSLCSHEGIAASQIDLQCLGHAVVCQGCNSTYDQSLQEDVQEDNKAITRERRRVTPSGWDLKISI